LESELPSSFFELCRDKSAVANAYRTASPFAKGYGGQDGGQADSQERPVAAGLVATVVGVSERALLLLLLLILILVLILILLLAFAKVL